MVKKAPQLTPEERRALLDWHARPPETCLVGSLPADPEARLQIVRRSPEEVSRRVFQSGDRQLAELFVSAFGKDPRWQGTVACMNRDILSPPYQAPSRRQDRSSGDEPCRPHRLIPDPFLSASGRRRGTLDVAMFREDVGDR